MNNESKIFVTIQPSTEGGLEWLEHDVGMLIEKAINYIEREKIRRWMENCKPGGFLMLNHDTEIVMCHGFQPEIIASPDYFADEGHRTTSESKTAFLRHRKEIGPVDRVEVRWEEGPIDCNTLVIGKNGNQMGLTGFAVGYEGEGFIGMTWLLDMCGMDYDKVELSNLNTYTQKEVVFTSNPRFASTIGLSRHDYVDPPIWSADVEVMSLGGEYYNIFTYPNNAYPGGDRLNPQPDIDNVVDFMLSEMELRGVQWSNEPRITVNIEGLLNNSELKGQAKMVVVSQSERIGWNYNVSNS